mmetsp:Transcript_13540/g.27953  ORF Transcript_13540/g.27953 Transcript_13540/m.27953 type:complete len:238 (+) Transcript_13540:953-1666(+)
MRDVCCDSTGSAIVYMIIAPRSLAFFTIAATAASLRTKLNILVCTSHPPTSPSSSSPSQGGTAFRPQDAVSSPPHAWNCARLFCKTALSVTPVESDMRNTALDFCFEAASSIARSHSSPIAAADDDGPSSAAAVATVRGERRRADRAADDREGTSPPPHAEGVPGVAARRNRTKPVDLQSGAERKNFNSSDGSESAAEDRIVSAMRPGKGGIQTTESNESFESLLHKGEETSKRRGH